MSRGEDAVATRNQNSSPGERIHPFGGFPTGGAPVMDWQPGPQNHRGLHGAHLKTSDMFRLSYPMVEETEAQERYHLLKLLQKFGTVKQFDFLFHKSGALEGQPRGYCFVNFETKQEAEQAIQCLNGKLALSKKLVVRWAHAQVKRYDHNKNDKILPISLEPSSSTEPTQSNLSVTAKIKAIEAKLKMMAENPDAEYPAAPVYSYFKPPDKKRTTPYSRTAWKSRR
uniref:Probable RNA-binding protein 18 n=1 Tax=Equus caballus TaxID=9796 RepID=A0A9L0S5V9_HORSE